MAAILYDLFLLIGVLFAATALVLPLNAGTAFTGRQIAYPIFLLTVSFLFYGWFWTHGGQTLGLKTWNLKVHTRKRENITWAQALLRFAGAILSWSFCGLGFIWILIDKNHRSWHDYLSNTSLSFAGENNDQASSASLTTTKQ